MKDHPYKLLRSGEAYKVIESGNRISVKLFSESGHRRLLNKTLQRIGDSSFLCAYTEAGENTLVVDENLEYVSDDLIENMSPHQCIEAALFLIKAYRQFIQRRVGGVVPHYELFRRDETFQILFCPSTECIYDTDLLSENFHEPYLKRMNELLIARATKILSGSKTLESLVQQIQKVRKPGLNHLQSLLEHSLLVLQVSGFLPQSIQTEKDFENTVYLRPRVREINKLVEFCGELLRSKKGIFHFVSKDGYEISELIKFAKPLLEDAGFQFLELKDLHSGEVEADVPKLIMASSIEIYQAHELLENNSNIGIVLVAKNRCDVSENIYRQLLKGPDRLYFAVDIPFYSESQCIQIVQDSLYRKDRRTLELGQRIFSITNGRYTDLKLALSVLLNDGSIKWDENRQRYEFGNVNLTEQDFFSVQLTNLSENEKLILKCLSCCFYGAKVSTLNKVTGISSTPLHHGLSSLASKSIIIQRNETFQFISPDLKALVNSFASEADKIRVHRQLWESRDLQVPASLCDVLHGLQSDAAKNQRNTVLQAAAYALQSELENDLELGVQVFRLVSTLVTVEDWTHRENTLRLIFLSGSQIHKELGNLADVKEIYEEVISQTSDLLGLCEFVVSLIELQKKHQLYRDAIYTGLEYLQYLGIKIPDNPSKWHLVISYLKTKLALSRSRWFRKGIIKHAEEKESAVISRVMGHIASACYMYRPKLFPLLCFYGVQEALKSGVCPEHSFAFAGYAFFVTEFGRQTGGVLDEATGVLRFSKAIQESGDVFYSARIRLIQSGLINNWREDQLRSIDDLLDGYKEGNRYGDFEYALYCAAIAVCLKLTRGASLSEIKRTAYVPLLQAREYKQFSTLSNLSLIQQFSDSLSGNLSEDSILDNVPLLGGVWNTEIEHGDKTVASIYIILRLFKATLFDDTAEAFELIAKSNLYLEGVQGQQLIVFFTFLETWVLLDKAGTSHVERKKLRKNIRQFSRWCVESTQNFEHYYIFLNGLVDYQAGNKNLKPLEKAYRKAKSKNYIHVAAMFAEKIALLCIEENNIKDARSYLKYSIGLYNDWGASEKAALLESEHRRFIVDEREPVLVLKTEQSFPVGLVEKLSKVKDKTHNNEGLIEELLRLILSITPVEQCAIMYDFNGRKTVEIQTLKSSNSILSGEDVPYSTLSEERVAALSGNGKTFRRFSENIVECNVLYKSQHHTVVLEVEYKYANSQEVQERMEYLFLYLAQVVENKQQKHDHLQQSKKMMQHHNSEKLLRDALERANTLVDAMANDVESTMESLSNICNLLSATELNDFQTSLSYSVIDIVLGELKRVNRIQDNKSLLLESQRSSRPILILCEKPVLTDFDQHMVTASGLTAVEVGYHEISENEIRMLDPQVILMDCSEKAVALAKNLCENWAPKPPLLALGGEGSDENDILFFDHIMENAFDIFEVLKYTINPNIKLRSVELA